MTALTDMFNAILSPHICSSIGFEDLFIYLLNSNCSDGS